MTEPARGVAFGAPGFEARWTHSTKEGIGTSYHTSCRLWFTLSHGIINEIYYPHVDQPCTRDFQFLITDGETFCHEERRDLDHAIEYPERGALLYRIINSDRAGRYRVIKEICTDPHSSVLLTHTRIEITDETLRRKLRVFALLAPHLIRGGMHNNAALTSVGGRNLVRAWRDNIHLVMGCEPDFTRRSVGYVGASDGWQDLQNFALDWEFSEALDGNVALTAEVDLSSGFEFVIGVSMGRSKQSSATKLLQSLGTPFPQQREAFVRQWDRSLGGVDLTEETRDGGKLFWLSRSVLLAHEDKTFVGALVASMSIPWGEVKGDDELGGYHLVWSRDIVQSALGLLASGRKGTARRALIWLACLQESSGRLPQNSWISGEPYWMGLQLDEVAAPVLLAHRLHELDALDLFHPWVLATRAARFLILNGPVTKQERWEENAGYSPGTLASIVAALACVADLARNRDDSSAQFLLEYADWLSARIDGWTTTTRGELVPGIARHYIRITPSDPFDPRETADPDYGMVQIANGGGLHPARNVVSGDFLQLVRLGLRDPNDPLIRDSIAVIDAVLKSDLPQGPCWRRYNHDGYGQKADGSAFDGAGEGGCWPLLTGERGHYELAAGRDPLPFIEAMERFANAGGMLPEQVSFGLTNGFPAGAPTGSAMPLCWAHAEYLSLVRSRAEGAPFDRVRPAYDRYVVQRRRDTPLEIWTLAHRLTSVRRGKTLRIITSDPAEIQWRLRSDAPTQTTATTSTPLGLWFADLPTAELDRGDAIEFSIGAGSERHVVPIREA
ncbi:MAG: glycoside hydrolase family 15 protein [Chthoniobacterales bacterium]